MKRLLNILVLLCLVQTSIGQIYLKPNNSYGVVWNRARPDSTQLLPTGCGTPSGIASLRSTNQRMGGLYYDSCANKIFLFNPTDSLWTKQGVTQLNDSTFVFSGDTITIVGGGGSTTPETVNSIIGDGSAGDKIRLVNDESNPNKWEFYGTNLKDSVKGYREIEENFLGILYNKSSWTSGDLATDFTQNGVTASIVSNKIQVSPVTAGTFTATLDFENLANGIKFVNLQKWRADLRIRLDVVNGTSFGEGIGLKSFNDFCFVNALGRLNGVTGNLLLNGHNDNQQLNATTRTLGIATNDYILLTVERDGSLLSIKARNVTSNSSIIDTTYTYSYLASPSMPNTGKFAIYSFGGQFTIDSICISSKEVRNSRLMIGGDSKTQGYYASSAQTTMSALLNYSYKTTTIMAGGCDRTVDLSRTVPLIIAARPQQFIMNIGSNDYRQGLSSSATLTRYDSITNALLAAGIDVYHIVMYESSLDLSTLKNHIYSTYGNKVIDVFSLMQAPGNLNLDGIHPNDQGMATAANGIIQSYKLYGGNNRYGSNTSTTLSGSAGTLPKFTTTTSIGNSSLTETSTQVITPLPIQSVGFTMFRPVAGTNEKYTNLYADNTSFRLGFVNDANNTTTDFLSVQRSGTTPQSLNLNAPVVVDYNTASALSITPYASRNGLNINGSVTGYHIPINILVGATSGLLVAQQNTSTDAGAFSRFTLATAGGTSEDPAISWRDNGAGIDWFAGMHIPTGTIRINSGNFNGLRGGTNHLTIKRTGEFGINTSNPLVSLHVGGSDAVGINGGTSAQRPTGAAGYIRWNTDSTSFEYYDGSAWKCIASRDWVRSNFGTGTGSGLPSTITTYTSSTSAILSDATSYIFLDGTSSAVTYTINPATFSGKTLIIKCINATNTVKIAPSSGTIDGAAEVELLLSNIAWVTSDGTNLFVVNN